MVVDTPSVARVMVVPAANTAVLAGANHMICVASLLGVSETDSLEYTVVAVVKTASGVAGAVLSTVNYATRGCTCDDIAGSICAYR